MSRFALFFTLLFCLLPTSVTAAQLRIAVASNFSSAMQAIANKFEQQSDHHVDLIFGSTGKLYAQIINGAPFDAFFAADIERPLRLEQEKRIQPYSRFSYAFGQLVLWSSDPNRIDADAKVLQSGNFRHLAIANPNLAPYGLAAQQVLQKHALWDKLQSNIVRGENIGQTFHYVKSGNAELGFVALSQLNQDDLNHGSYWLVPTTLYAPIEQQAVQLTDNDATTEFLQFVRSANIQSLIHQYGYLTP